MPQVHVIYKTSPQHPSNLDQLILFSIIVNWPGIIMLLYYTIQHTKSSDKTTMKHDEWTKTTDRKRKNDGRRFVTKTLNFTCNQTQVWLVCDYVINCGRSNRQNDTNEWRHYFKFTAVW